MSRRMVPGAMVGGAVLQAVARHGLAAVPPSPVVAWRGMALPMAAVGFGGEVFAAPVARTTVVSAPITSEGCAGGGQNEQRGKGTYHKDLFFHDLPPQFGWMRLRPGRGAATGRSRARRGDGSRPFESAGRPGRQNS